MTTRPSPLRLLAALALLASSRASEADTCTYSTELDCLKAGGRTAYACAWCKSAAIPSSCATLEHASKLPPSDFDCGNSTRADCDLQKTIGACEGVVGCLWCTSKTVKPICGNYMNASTLPKSVFTCAGPYAEAAEAAAAEAMRPEEEEAPAVASSPDASTYDFFMHVEQWAITECQDAFKCSAAWTYFTMHGLWPERNDGSYPQNCAGAPAFDPSQLAPILPALNRFWPSLNGPSQSFWEHEWSTHGSCATDVFAGQLDFFNSTLNFLAQYNITAALAAHGILPSNTKSFPLTAFNAALEAEFGQTAVLTCDSQHRIEVATLCISKQGKAIACPASIPRKCSGGLAFLPASM